MINTYQAKSQLSSLVEEAAAGEEIVIAEAGVPRARLVPVRRVRRRRPGGSKGRIRIGADFDAGAARDPRSVRPEKAVTLLLDILRSCGGAGVTAYLTVLTANVT